MNLLGVQSAKIGKTLTLDKLNRAIRYHVRNRDVELKIYQTHKIEYCITLLQRNRNWADHVIIAPQAWARYEGSLKDTIKIISPPVTCVYFKEKEYNLGTLPGNSILGDVVQTSVTGNPPDIYLSELTTILQ